MRRSREVAATDRHLLKDAPMPKASLQDQLKVAPVVPLVQSEDPETAVKIARALCDGGLKVIEVVLRTDAALDCLSAIAEKLPDAIVGAGTVLDEAQADQSIARGASFIVSPGLNPAVVTLCQEKKIDIFPGVVTPSEVQAARNLGLRAVKFFPASLSGGAPMLKALGSVFREMLFMPTGGVSAANLRDFLDIPSVIACGGSWLTPKAEIEAGNFDAITALAKEAVDIARA